MPQCCSSRSKSVSVSSVVTASSSLPSSCHRVVVGLFAILLVLNASFPAAAAKASGRGILGLKLKRMTSSGGDEIAFAAPPLQQSQHQTLLEEKVSLASSSALYFAAPKRSHHVHHGHHGRHWQGQSHVGPSGSFPFLSTSAQNPFSPWLQEKTPLLRSSSASSHGSIVLHALSHDTQEEQQDDNDQQEGDPMTQALLEEATSSKPANAALPYVRVLLPLLIIFVSNQWIRSAIFYLVDFTANASPYTAVNVALNFSETDYGVLASVAFTALFALASLFAGTLADRLDRIYLLIGSCLVWSAATLGSAAAVNYGQLLIGRILTGLACAFTTPAAVTTIRDAFPPDRAALATSAFTSAVYLGGALSSLSILLDARLGWRGALEVMGVFGAVAALVAFLILPRDLASAQESLSASSSSSSSSSLDKDDEFETTNGKSTPNKMESTPMAFWRDVQDILAVPVVRWLLLSTLARFASGLCIGVWAAPFYKMAFPNNANVYGVVNAFIVGICGVSSVLVGGALTDALSSRGTAPAASSENDTSMTDTPDDGEEDTHNNNQFLDTLLTNFPFLKGRMTIPLSGALLAAPAWWLSVHANSFEYAMLWLAVEYLFAECWFGTTVAAIQASVKPNLGGTAQGLFTLTGAAGQLAPAALGFVYENMAEGLVDTSVSSSTVDTVDVVADAAVALSSSSNAASMSDTVVLLSDLLGMAVCGGYIVSAVACVFADRAAEAAAVERGRGGS